MTNLLIGAACIALAFWMINKQRGAANCSQHNRLAGMIAWLLALLLLVIGLAGIVTGLQAEL